MPRIGHGLTSYNVFGDQGFLGIVLQHFLGLHGKPECECGICNVKTRRTNHE